MAFDLVICNLFNVSHCYVCFPFSRVFSAFRCSRYKLSIVPLEIDSSLSALRSLIYCRLLCMAQWLTLLCLELFRDDLANVLTEMYGFCCILHRCTTVVPYGPANALCALSISAWLHCGFPAKVSSVVTVHRLNAQVVAALAPAIVDSCIALHSITLHGITLVMELGLVVECLR